MSNIKITAEDLKLINQYTRRGLTENNIYTFKIVLCDNKVDKDYERFSIATLQELSKMFLGKSGVVDSSNSITSRIYKTYIVTDYNNKIENGEPYTYLGADAYIMRSDKSYDLINKLESGCKKEVSVGCSVSTLKCSICSQDVKRSQCNHIKGNLYNGKQCHYVLGTPMEAYEWTLVSQPVKRTVTTTKVHVRKIRSRR